MVHVLCMMHAFCTEQSVQTAWEYKTMQVWMTLRVLLTKLGAFCFFCDFHIVRLSSASMILFYTVWHITLLHCFFFNDHFPNSRCLVQCFISPNKTSLSFLENFIMMVLVIIAVWEDTKNNNGLSKRKQQRISVYLYLTCTFTLSDNKTGITGTGEWKKVLQKSLKL